MVIKSDVYHLREIEGFDSPKLTVLGHTKSPLCDIGRVDPMGGKLVSVSDRQAPIFRTIEVVAIEMLNVLRIFLNILIF